MILQTENYLELLNIYNFKNKPKPYFPEGSHGFYITWFM